MTPGKQGQFCGSCQKHVIDFSKYSDTALYNFFKAKPQGVCGRFRHSQLNRNILVPPQPHSRLYRVFVGLGLTLMMAVPSQRSFAKPPRYASELVTTNYENNDENTSDGANAVIRGKVTDEKGGPLGIAEIIVMQKDLIVAFTHSKDDGTFELKLNRCKYDLRVTTGVLHEAITMRIDLRQNPTFIRDFVLKENPEGQMVMGGIHSLEVEAPDSCGRK